MLRKCFAAILSIALIATVLTGCGTGSKSASAPASTSSASTSEAQENNDEKTIEFRIASPFDTSTTMLQAANKFIETVNEKSGGKLKGTIYSGGVMGGEAENTEALQTGEIEMAVLGTYPIVTLAPQYGFFDAPCVFQNREHYFNTWEGELGDGVREIFHNYHIKALGLMGRGYRHITSNTPINSVSDLQGIKMRMGQSTPFINAFSEIGAVVVPIALPELFTSLQMGVVSSSEGPFDQIYSYKLYEVQKNLALSYHMYATSIWLMNEDFYNGLSDEYKTIIDESAKECLAYGTELSDKAESELLQELKDNGMEVTEPDRNEFREKAMPAINKLFESDWEVTTMEEINKYES